MPVGGRDTFLVEVTAGSRSLGRGARERDRSRAASGYVCTVVIVPPVETELAKALNGGREMSEQLEILVPAVDDIRANRRDWAIW